MLLKKNLPKVFKELGQYKNYNSEIIVVDDSSTDKSILLLKEFAAKYPVAIDDVYAVKKDNPKFKVRGSDATFQLDSATSEE